MAEKDWEARQQDYETARQQDYETTRPRDNGTTRLRDCEATRLRKMRASPAISRSPEVSKSRNPRKTQAFSGVLRRSQLCVAVRGSLASEGRRVLHSAKMPSMGSTKAYVPLTAFFVRGRNRPLITPSSLLEADRWYNLCTLLSLPVLRLVEAKERRYDGRGELAY